MPQRVSAIEVISRGDSGALDESDRARFDELQTDEATVRQLRYLLREHDRLPAARALLEGLRKTATSRSHKHAIDGFIMATYYEVGEHVAGLEFLARATRDVPMDDFRYRWQFHEHIRAVASTKGREEAERLLETFARTTHRPEISRVWIGVPRDVMRALRAGDTAQAWELEEEDVAYLRGLTQTDGDDPFIDHAYYVLGAYDVVLASHPRSLLRDAALRAAIYRALSCAQAPDTCDLVRARRRLAELANEFPGLEYDTAKRAGSLLAKAGRLADAQKFACGDYFCEPEERWQMLEAALTSPHIKFGAVVAWLEPDDAAQLDEFVDRAFESADESIKHAEVQDYAGALAVLQDYERKLAQVGIRRPAMLSERRKHYSELATRARPRTAEEYFQYGLAEMRAARRTRSSFMGALFRSNAADTFGLVERVGPRSEWAPKSCYLRAAAFRKLREYEKADEVTEHFLATHRNSPLYDDMLAEKGWHLLRVVQDNELAEKILEDVARRFPHGNAADNALTLLAESKWEQCRFTEALDVYHRIIKAYPKTRLGLRAQQNARYLTPIVRTRRVVAGVRGLDVWEADGRTTVRSHSQRNAFLPRDMITMVGDTHVRTLASFHAAMAAQQPGSTILVRVTSPTAKTRFLRVRVESVEAYDPERVSSDCRS